MNITLHGRPVKCGVKVGDDLGAKLRKSGKTLGVIEVNDQKPRMRVTRRNF